MARTNLSIDRAVFEEFSTQAERRNMTLYAFANESLDVVARIAAEGGDPSDLYRLWKVLSILKEVDVIVLPSDFVEDMIKQLYRIDKRQLLSRFSELGSSLVALLKIAASDIEGLSALAKGFIFLIPVKHFEIQNGRNGTIEVNVVGAGRGLETTECSSEFLKSVLNGYGCTVTKEEIHAGVIRLWAEIRNKKNLLTEATADQV
jgi:hypothetical protein